MLKKILKITIITVSFSTLILFVFAIICGKTLKSENKYISY